MAAEPTRYRIGTGATSLLMILFVLSLTILAALSYSSAVSDSQLQNKADSINEQVMAASNEAQRTIASIDALLYEKRDFLSSDDLIDAAAELCGDAAIDGNKLTFSVPAGESLTLNIILQIQNSDFPVRYSILEYKTVPNDSLREFDYFDDHLEVF